MTDRLRFKPLKNFVKVKFLNFLHIHLQIRYIGLFIRLLHLNNKMYINVSKKRQKDLRSGTELVDNISNFLKFYFKNVKSFKNF